MPVNPKNIIASKTMESAQTTQFTSHNLITIIDKFTATNCSGSAASVSVNLVPYTEMPGDSNLIVAARVLQPLETYTFPEIVGHILSSGGYISTLASAPAAINFRASGREVS